MKKIGVLIIASLFLIGFLGSILAITGSAINEETNASARAIIDSDNITRGIVNRTLTTNNSYCAQDSRLCSDGSYASRDPTNNCEFYTCPRETNEEETNDINNEEKVCCAISGALAGAEPSYKILNKSRCKNIDGLMDINKEIVDNSFCNQTIIRERPRLNNSQVKKLIQVKNKLITQVQNGTCPEKCTCTGSVTKCEFANGTREMTIRAGNSGNTIIQVQGINASTQVTLYKSEDGRIYAVNENNETKEIRMLPDQVKDRIKKKITARLENENITLNENGTYEYQAEKKARLFFIFPVRTEVRATVNAETGEVTQISKPKWWEFLAKEDKADVIVGESCGTVTPGYNDACCQTKGYEVWNQETSECEFLE